MPYSHSELKNKQRRVRDNFHENVSTRIHRALSWLQRAELCEDDLDAKFLFLWISFNAAYGQEHENFYKSETELFSRFIHRLVALDNDKELYDVLWQQFTPHIKLLLNNEFVFQPFWDYQKELITEAQWQKQFQNERGFINAALASQSSEKVLCVILRRLYTLRNQLVHGGSTWNSVVNRPQLKDAVAIMENIVPIVINLMLDNAIKFMGKPSYPLIGPFVPMTDPATDKS